MDPEFGTGDSNWYHRQKIDWSHSDIPQTKKIYLKEVLWMETFAHGISNAE
jgi:hypothetical protein